MAPTYVFKHGKVYTVVGGKVVAAVKESDFEEGHDFEDGWKLHRLKTNQDFIDEGQRMENCLGMGCDPDDPEGPASGQYGKYPTWSLRDPEGNSKANYTPGIGPWGPQNAAPDDEIIERLRQWDPDLDLGPYLGGKTAGFVPIGKEAARKIAVETHPDLIPPGIDLVGIDGNAFAIMGEMDRALKRAGNSQEVVDAYMADATSGDYDHLLQVTMAYNGDFHTSKVARPVGEFVEPVDNLDEADKDLDMPDPPDDLQEDLLDEIVECPACGESADESDSFCSKCGEPLSDSAVKDDFEFSPLKDDFDFEDEGGVEDMMMSARPIAKVTTPNGLEGKVMNRVAGLWGDEVTVRFENGMIKKMPVTGDMKFSKIEEQVAESPIDGLRIKLDASVEGDLPSLRARKEDLQSIQVEASKLIRVAKTHEERKELDQIALEASFEAKEVDAAIEHYIDAKNESFIPTTPFKSSAVEQASLGAGDGGWLAEVVSSMNEDARSTDYAKLMEEGPIAFIVEADDATVANAGATRIAATRYVRQFTSASSATTTKAQRSQYEKHFLDRVEDARKNEFRSRKAATRKEASKAVEAATDAPDDALFL